MGLPITFLENGKIIKESPDGTRVILGTIQKWPGKVISYTTPHLFLNIYG